MSVALVPEARTQNTHQLFLAAPPISFLQVVDLVGGKKRVSHPDSSVCAYLTVFRAAALVAGGQEMDELQGSAVLEVRGDVSARLLRGERVTSLLILGNTLELRNLPGMVSLPACLPASQMLWKVVTTSSHCVRSYNLLFRLGVTDLPHMIDDSHLRLGQRTNNEYRSLQ